MTESTEWAMQQLDSLSAFSGARPANLVLTIGNFDGLHLGHLAILKRLREVADKHSGQSVVITFQNHPKEVLQQVQAVPRLCSEEQKRALFHQAGVDLLFQLPFTRAFSEQSTETFIQGLRKYLPFEALILGHDARMGKDREGSPDCVKALAHGMGFDVEYLSPVLWEGKAVSSSRIRELIQRGDLDAAAQLLGRPYSLMGAVQPGLGRGQGLGYPTANIDVLGYCLPPLGVYAVSASIYEGSSPCSQHMGIANLGHAPTIQKERGIKLEVHLFDSGLDAYGKTLEVTLLRFIRPEQYFESEAALQQQIAKDSAAAVAICNAAGPKS